MEELQAMQAEANGAVDVTWRDMTFTIRPAEEWMIEYSHYAERGKITLAIEVMLGAKHYAEFIAARPTGADVHSLISTILSAWGLDPKEYLP